MPQQKDLKRLIRARMRKTGESYTTARAHVRGTSSARSEPSRAATASERAPARADYAKLAGQRDATMRTRTGRPWREWLAVLDEAGAATMTHGQIAKLVHEVHGVPGWWAQCVTVGYERIRGKRDVGQRMDGSFEASKSKTLAAPIRVVFRALTHAPTRRKWLSTRVVVRTSVANKSVRMTWDDGTSVEAYLVAKGAAKTQLAIAHRKLADKAALERAKREWTERLGALDRLLRGA